MRISDLGDRDVAILGAGREGRAVWRQLRRRFPAKPLVIYSESPVAPGFAADFRGERDSLVVGPLDDARLSRHEVLVRSPGISPYRTELAAVRRAGIEFTTASSLWFAEHPDARTICITGTKGKSTTSALTAHLMRRAGCTVKLAGNIGQVLLGCPDSGVDWWVIELSSFQLADLVARPTIGVILNLSDAHLDWHGGSEAYRKDKLRIADLAAETRLVANHADPGLRERLASRGGIAWFGGDRGWHVRDGQLWAAAGRIELEPPPALPGTHNLLNLCAALTVLEQAGVEPPALQAALGSFESLPHRLQRLGKRAGLEFYDDSLATTPVATLAALNALGDRTITLILGGQEQRLDWRAAMEEMRDARLHAMIALPDSGAVLAKLARAAGLAQAGGIHEVADLAEAVSTAQQVSPPGGIVLLSPGAPSFPQFRDYADRGRQFARLAGFGFDDEDHGSIREA